MIHDNAHELYLLDQTKLDTLQNQKQYLGGELSDSMLAFAGNMVSFAETHRGLCCGITKIRYGGQRMIWIPHHYYHSNQEWIRVSVLNAVCPKCNWRGFAADPTLPSLYDGEPDRIEKMRRAAQRKRVACPVCGGVLNHHGMHPIAVWDTETGISDG